MFVDVGFEQNILTFELICPLFHAESGPESVPPGSLSNVPDNAGVQGSPLVNDYGQGSPAANSSVSPSGEDLVFHPVSWSAFFSAEGRLWAGSLGLKTKRISFDRSQSWS